MALVPEGRRLFPRLTVSENLMLGAFRKAARRDIDRNLELAFETFPLLKERQKQLAGTLSGGQQQMLAIARALMSSPRLLLIDEPSVGLSPLLVSQTIAKIGELNKRVGLTVLMAEQNFNQADSHRRPRLYHRPWRDRRRGGLGRRAEGQRHRQAALSRRRGVDDGGSLWHRAFCPRRSSAAIRSRTGWSTASNWRRAWRACASISGALPEPWLEQAQDDATLLAIRDMERAGIDIVTDGEMRRESYSNRFATELEGIECGTPGQVVSKAGLATLVPRVVGRIRRTRAVEVRDMQFLRSNTERTAKITLPGPFTMSRQAVNEHYSDPDEMVMDFAAAVNAEARDLEKAGADVIQLDEPWLRQDPAAAKRIAVRAIDRALDGIKATTVVHLCFGYAAVVAGQKPVGYSFLTELAACAADQISIEAAQPKLDLGVLKDLAPKKIMLGVIDLSDPAPETPAMVANRIRAALKHIAPERLIPAPDCGMKYLPRDLAFAKLKALADGAALVRSELS